MHIYVSSNIGHLYVIGNIFKYKSTILNNILGRKTLLF